MRTHVKSAPLFLRDLLGHACILKVIEKQVKDRKKENLRTASKHRWNFEIKISGVQQIPTIQWVHTSSWMMFLDYSMPTTVKMSWHSAFLICKTQRYALRKKCNHEIVWILCRCKLKSVRLCKHTLPPCDWRDLIRSTQHETVIKWNAEIIKIKCDIGQDSL